MLEILRFFNHGYLARELLAVLDRDSIKMSFTGDELRSYGLLRRKLTGIAKPRTGSDLSGLSGGCNGTCFSLVFGRVGLTLQVWFAEASDGDFCSDLFILFPITSAINAED